MQLTDDERAIVERALRAYLPKREPGPYGTGTAAREQHTARELADRFRVGR